jgi:sugar phosphate isomerase/epimerase
MKAAQPELESGLERLQMNRRAFIGSAAAAMLAAAPPLRAAGRPRAPLPAPAAGPARRYRIGVCDWMILRRQHIGAFQRTREIGADGVELDMGGLGDRETFNSKLFDPVERHRFRAAAREHGVEICSIAMSGFYGQSFAERPGVVERMVVDCINTMELMGVKVAFLPLGVPSNLVDNPGLRPAVVERLRKAGAMAEAAGVVIGIETMLDAAAEVELLEEIGSPAIRSYFNFANAIRAGRDIPGELAILGRERVCQIHCTDTDGVWLEHNPRIDMPAIKAALDAMDWSGWLVIERSRDASRVRDVVGNYGANTRYLKSIFQS